MLQQVMLYNIDKNCIYVLFKWEHFYTDGKRLPYPYSAWFLDVYLVPVVIPFFPLQKKHNQTHSSLRSKMSLFALYRK